MQVAVEERAATRAITIAEYPEWPDRLDWDEGPDVLRCPDLYDPNDDQDADLEPLGPSRSSLVITNWSPFRLADNKARSSSSRRASLPEALSMNTASQPAARSASCWASG
jgi:hypothetical protein